MSYWTSLVSDAQFDELMEECDSRTRRVNWSVHRLAKAGDVAIFYATAPISSFVATAKVVKMLPFKEGDRWHHADMRELRRLPVFYHIRKARNELPEWGWLKTPIASVKVPAEVVGKLLSRLTTRGAAPDPSLGHLGTDLIVPDDDKSPPTRVSLVTTRIVRTSAKAAKLKELYDHECQYCLTRIQVPGGRYVEVHHLRPLGSEHRGLDNWDNMVVLCPNCHTRFDLLALAINPISGKVETDANGGANRSLHFRAGHRLAAANISYHWKRFRSAHRH